MIRSQDFAPILYLRNTNCFAILDTVHCRHSAEASAPNAEQKFLYLRVLCVTPHLKYKRNVTDHEKAAEWLGLASNIPLLQGTPLSVPLSEITALLKEQ